MSSVYFGIVSPARQAEQGSVYYRLKATGEIVALWQITSNPDPSKVVEELRPFNPDVALVGELGDFVRSDHQMSRRDRRMLMREEFIEETPPVFFQKKLVPDGKVEQLVEMWEKKLQDPAFMAEMRKLFPDQVPLAPVTPAVEEEADPCIEVKVEGS